MKNNRIRFLSLIFVVVILVASLTCCTAFGAYGSEEFDQYCDELVYYMLNGDALSINFLLSDPATYGLENSTAMLYVPNLDENDYYDSYSAYGSLNSDLMNFNFSTLTQKQKDTWQMLMNSFSDVAKKKDYFYLQSGYLGSVSGTNCNLPVELAEFKFTKLLDIDNYLSLLEQSESAFKTYCDYELIRVNNGYGRSDAIYQGIVDQCLGFAPAGEDANNFLVANFDAKIDSCDFLNDTEKAEYKLQHLTLLTEKLLPAYRTTAQTIQAFVGNENNNNLGLYHFEGGESFYQIIFNSKTSTSDSIQTAYNNLLSFFNNSVTTYQTLLASYDTKYDKSNLDADTAELTANQDLSMSSLQTVIATLEDEIANDFPTLPSTIPTATFNYVDESLADFYSPAAYFLSTADSLSSPEIIYINSYSSSDYNTFELLSHEGYPGHLLQNAYFKSTDVSPVRRLFGFTGYSEGWGNYAQFYTSKYYSDDERQSLVYQLYLQDKITTGILVSLVDIVVNGLGYDLNQTANYLANFYNTEASELTDYAQNLIDFVVENPANYPAYYYGYYKMLALRDSYKQIYGESYTDLSFHTAVLSAGPMTFDQLEDKLLG